MAQNDPQWGRRGNDGPPDLDEIFRKLSQKLNSIFGSKGGNSVPQGPANGGRVFVGGAGLLVSIVAALWLASGFYTVDPRERGVITRFGRYVETTSEGLHWHWPYPIERREVINMTTIRTVEVGHRNGGRTKVPEEALMVTGDQNIIDLQFSVQYFVKDASAYLFNNRNGDADARDLVLQVSESAIREVVGKNQIDYLLNEGRAEVAVQATRLIQQMLDRYNAGIQIAKVNMSNAQPPEQVQAAFDDAVKAGQDKDRLKSEGEAYANDVIPKARGLAARLIEEANAHKQRVVSTAQGDVSRFNQIYAEYKKAPGVTRERMYIDTMQQVLNNSSKVLVDQKGGNSLLYLPLDKLMQMNNAGQSAAPVAPTASTDNAQKAPVEVLTQSGDANRPRDFGRSREREGR